MKDKSELQGIGGWLILPAIGVFLGPFIAIGMDFVAYEPYFQGGDFFGSVSYYNSVIPNFSIVFWAELLFAIVIDVLIVYLVYLMVAKKSFFPILYVRIIYISLAYIIIDYSAVYLLMGDEYFSIDSMDIRAIFQTLFSLAVWVPYMKKSVRVKNTFIN